MIEHFVIGILVVVMLAQNVFWAKVVLNLTNRLMSRNYAELRQAEAKPTLVQTRPLEDEGTDPVSERQAKDLNSLMGMV